MEDQTSQGNSLKQPKKRFVGRRTADAQAQKEPGSQQDVESTSVQRGMQICPLYQMKVLLTSYQFQLHHEETLEH